MCGVSDEFFDRHVVLQVAQRKAADAGTALAQAERTAGQERQKAGQALQAHQAAADALQQRLQAAQVTRFNTRLCCQPGLAYSVSSVQGKKGKSTPRGMSIMP